MMRFHTGMAAGIAMLTIFAGAAHAQPRVRQNIKDISSADQQRFVDAMFALQRLAPTGGVPADTNLPQNRYEQYVRAHDTNSSIAHDNTAAQTNPWFLPWHRQFLFQMENDVRAMGAVTLPDGRAQDFSTFTLPYWDGTRDAYPRTLVGDVGPQPPDSLMGGNGNGAPNFRVTTGPFAANAVPAAGQWTAFSMRMRVGTDPADPSPFFATRNALRREFDAVNAGPNPPAGSFTDLTTTGPASLTAALGAATFRALRGQSSGSGNPGTGLEGADGLHDDHHLAVGGRNGQLGNPTSGSTDPTFWLLHSFTDLQWAVWECDRGALYEVGAAVGQRVNDPMTGVGRTGTFGLSELNTGNIYNNPGNGVNPANVLNFLTMPGGGYTYDYRLDRTGETRTILGQGGNVCAVPAPGAVALLGLGGLLAARRGRRGTGAARSDSFATM